MAAAHKPRRVLIVPNLQPVSLDATSTAYTMTFDRPGTVVRLLVGTAQIDGSTIGVDSLELKVSLPGSRDLFSNGRGADFCNAGLLRLALNQGTAPTTVGGAGIDLWQKVSGGDVWSFTVKNVSLNDVLYPRLAVVFEDD